MNKSAKQVNLEKKIMAGLTGKSLDVAYFLFNDQEILTMQDYANTVSIKRLGFNDHGPVHMRKTALNSLTIFDLLAAADVKFNYEKEGSGTVEDSKIAVLTASLLHDLGMAVTRENHEYMSIIITQPIVKRLLEKFYKDDPARRYTLYPLIMECIFGHMATQQIYTLEAGIVLIGDGLDMEKGRARIPTLLAAKPRVGDIHKYSATAIDRVMIKNGETKPVRIEITMSSTVGFFQVEEVLYPKITSSPVRSYIELYAGVTGSELLKYH
ncbi:MAG: phosphohydrolase [Candidatus Cloacimonetes bacterium]|nr:phosphohydrolase [Candidatus Cloacimonadota bacterium]